MRSHYIFGFDSSSLKEGCFFEKKYDCAYTTSQTKGDIKSLSTFIPI